MRRVIGPHTNNFAGSGRVAPAGGFIPALPTSGAKDGSQFTLVNQPAGGGIDGEMDDLK
jgi:hypothetical protein